MTDANLVLGYLNPGYFNGGAMTLDHEAAREGIERAVGAPLEIAVGEAAWGIHAIANANMETAMRVVSIERGRDPRRYTLVAFGGAGPLHAARLARSLGIPRVIVPRGAGVGSAIGLLHSSPRIDLSVTRLLPLTTARSGALAAVYAELERRAAKELAELGTAAPPRLVRYAYMRHRGQGFEIKVDLPDGPIDGHYIDRATAAFFDAYARRYGYRDPEAAIEGVDWQLAAILPGSSTRGTPPAAAVADAPDATRAVYFPEAGGYTECRIVDRYRMAVDAPIPGPAIVEERECTTVVLPGDRVRCLPDGHLQIDITGASSE